MADLIDEQGNHPEDAARERRRWLWPALVAFVAVAAFVIFWFQPQKLFIDDTVDEAIPTVAPADGQVPPARPERAADPADPVEESRGDFVSLDHRTTGVARVLALADGHRIIRLEALDTDNGPDLYVYLSANRAEGEEGAFDDTYVSLGRLKGNKGDQNYDLPADVDLAAFRSIVIWCDRFDSAFGAADLVSP